MAKAVVGVAATALDFKVSGAGGKPKKSMATMRRGRLKLTHAPQREFSDAIMGAASGEAAGRDPRPWTPTKTQPDVRDSLR